MPDVRQLSDRDIRHMMDVLRKELVAYGLDNRQIDIKRFMGKDELRVTFTVRNNDIVPKEKPKGLFGKARSLFDN